MPQVSARIIVVRMAVARSEFMSFTPIFVKIAVNAAKRAESNAYNFHVETIYVEFNYSRTESRPQQGDDFQVFKY